jgi:hypothetical protein
MRQQGYILWCNSKKHRNLLRKISLDSSNALAVFMRMKPARIESARTFNAGNAASLG